MENKQQVWAKKSYEKRKSKGLYRNWKEKIRSERGDAAAQAYEAWTGMKKRVSRPTLKNSCYVGVVVCDRWMKSFEDFLSDMGLPGENMSIDRIDSNGNYEPSNCRWANSYTQARNRANNKLTLRKANAIRRRYLTEKDSQQKIANDYGITQSLVSRIVLFKAWPIV